MFDLAKIKNTEGYFAIPRKTGNVPVLFKIELEEKSVMRQFTVLRVMLDFTEITEVFSSTVYLLCP